MSICRKHKAQEKGQENKTPQASTSTDPTPNPIIYNYNQANEYFRKNFIGNPASGICNILWYMNDLKQVKEKHIGVLDPEFPDMDVAQFKACAILLCVTWEVSILGGSLLGDSFVNTQQYCRRC
jgi:hypothetical protein